VGLLGGCGFGPHLVHPLQGTAIASARGKNDKAGAAIVAQLLRADLLPEAWIGAPAVRQLRALLRHRAQLVRLRALLRNRIHAVLAGHGQDRAGGCWSGPGRPWLAWLDLPAVSGEVVQDDLALIDGLQQPIGRPGWQVRQRARGGPRVKVVTPLPGVGPFTALVLLAEIGDITRFAPARKLASWAGLTPTVRGSDRTVRHGHISQAGPGLGPLGLVRGGADRQAAPALRRQLPGHRQTARQQDRHHRDRPQAAHPRLPPAHRRPDHRATGRRRTRAGPGQCALTDRNRRSPAPGEPAKPHEPATPRSMT
jgi:hypothetical protein